MSAATKKAKAAAPATPADWRPTTPVRLLRTTDADGRAHGGFQWPRAVGAVVEATVRGRTWDTPTRRRTDQTTAQRADKVRWLLTDDPDPARDGRGGRG